MQGDADAAQIKQMWLRQLYFLPVFFALLFAPAWTLDYWQAWLYGFVFIATTSAIGLYFLKRDPKVVARRMTVGPAAEQEPAQKIIMTIIFAGFIALIAVPGFDRHWHWSNVPAWLVLVSEAFVVFGFFGTAVVIRQNSYAGGDHPGRGRTAAGLDRALWNRCATRCIPPRCRWSRSRRWRSAPIGRCSIAIAFIPALAWRLLDEERVPQAGSARLRKLLPAGALAPACPASGERYFSALSACAAFSFVQRPSFDFRVVEFSAPSPRPARRDDDAREPFAVGGHHMPRRLGSRSRGSCPHRLPCISAQSLRSATSPIENFQRLPGSSSRARKRLRCSSLETLQEEFQDQRAVAREMAFEIADVLEALVARYPCRRARRQLLAFQQFRVHAHDQHFLVVGAVEDADTPALGQALSDAPEKIVIELLLARLLERMHLAALRIDAATSRA